MSNNSSSTRVRHIVQFKLRTDLDASERQHAYQTFKHAIEALPAAIPTIVEIEVSCNINPCETWDICLNALFDNLNDVANYANHPLHLEAAGKLKPYVQERSCVDYVTQI